MTFTTTTNNLEADITAFGYYLLSDKRRSMLHPDADPSLVYHSDVANFFTQD